MDEYRKTLAVSKLEHCDERIQRALAEENAYWQTQETKMQNLRTRFSRAIRS